MKHTHSRVREGGTLEIVPTTAEERIEAMRQIVSRSQFAKVDGVMIDLSTAWVITQVYEVLSPKHRQIFAAMPARRMGEIAWKLA